MAITTLAMVATVFVLNLYQMKEKPMPKWCKIVFLEYAAKFLCMCSCGCPPAKQAAVADAESNMPSRSRSRSRTAADRNFPYRRKSSADDAMLPLRAKSHDSATQRKSLVPPGSDSARDLSPGRYQIIFGDPRRYGMRGEDPKDKDKKQDFSKDWVHVAAVFDRLFFWMCLIFIVLTTLVLFHPITTSRLFKIKFLESSDKG